METFRKQSALLFLLDAVGLFVLFNLAYKARIGNWISLSSSHLWILIAVALITLYVMDVYRITNSHTMERLPLETFAATIIVAISSVIVTYVFGVGQFTPVFGRGVLPVAICLFALWAPFWRWVFVKWHADTNRIVNWLVVCHPKSFDLFKADSEQYKSDIQFEQCEPAQLKTHIDRLAGQGKTKSGIIIENFLDLDSESTESLKRINVETTPVLSINEFYERFWMKLPILNLEGDWLIRSRGFDLLNDQVGIRLKRVADLVFGVSMLVLVAPLMLIIAIAIRLDSKGKAIYSQTRVGRNSQEFTLYKFRSMVQDAEQVGAQWATVKDPRITRVGKLLRSCRLDELPQLWNLIMGNMSLIGPRPERPEFVERLEDEIPFYGMRHQVTPGLTGWAQVMYSYGASVEDARKKLEYDLYYIKNHSIKLDMAIVLKTVNVVLTGGGR